MTPGTDGASERGEREKMLAGEPYDPFDPELVRDRERARALTRRFDDTAATEMEARQEVLEELFGSIGSGATVESPFRCDYGYNVHVGEDFYANFGCVILDVCPVTFGADCLLGPGVHVYTAAHPTDAAARLEGLEWGEPVSVGANVWIGGRAVLTPGVSISEDAIVAAGAIVTEDVPENTLAAGNPAQVKGDLE